MVNFYFMGRKKRGLTDKMRKFCREYLVDLNKSAAAVRAGYSPNASHVTGCQLMSDPRINRFIEKLQAEARERNNITIDELVGALANIARADPANYYDQEGGLLPLSEMSPEARAAIEDLSSTRHYLGGEYTGTTHKLKLTGKQAAIDKLLKVLGGYEKHNDQKRPDPIILGFNPLLQKPALGAAIPEALPEAEPEDNATSAGSWS